MTAVWQQSFGPSLSVRRIDEPPSEATDGHAQLRRNPALLKLDLYCKRRCAWTTPASSRSDGGRKILRTRAGLGSGLELILPGGLWTNVPVDRALRAALALRRSTARRGRYVAAPRRRAGGAGAPVAAARLVRAEDLERQADDAHRHAAGHLPRHLSGEGLRVLDGEAGEASTASSARWASTWAWTTPTRSRWTRSWRWCARPGASRASPTWTSTPATTRVTPTSTSSSPTSAASKRETGLLVGVQTPPHHDLRRYDGLREMGVNRVSFCFEIFDRERFRRDLPRQARASTGSTATWRRSATARRSARQGPRREPWVTNGEIIAGLEPPESSIARHRLDHVGRRDPDRLRVPAPASAPTTRTCRRRGPRTWCRSSAGSTKPAWSAACPSAARPTCTSAWCCCRRSAAVSRAAATRGRS